MALNNPLKSIMNIRKEELPLSLLMFFYFFLVIVSFQILKPLKKGVFIEYYDQTGFNLFGWKMLASQAEQLAKVLNMVVALLAVIVFTWLARRLHRQQLTFVFSIFIMFMFVIYNMFLSQPADITAWTFYLFGDLYSTLMVATFFAFLNDSVTPYAAKRLYGLVVLGGVGGGAFGSLLLDTWIDKFPYSRWMWICLGIAVIIIVLSVVAGRIVSKNPPDFTAPSQPEQETKEKKASLLFEAGKLVFKSRYLIAIVAIVGLYEIVSTTVDFQFSTTIGHFLDGPAITYQIAKIYKITNFVSLFVQLFLTSFIMTRFSVKTALMVLPVMIALGSLGFVAMPVLWVGSRLNTVDNGFAYSINQSAKEVLYTITTKKEKYMAKAFIDMFFQRFAKALAVGVSLATTAIFASFSTIRWLSLFNIAVVVLWILAVRYAGNKFKEVTEPDSV
jgi:AAA family ATP:ADP antiporter